MTRLCAGRETGAVISYSACRSRRWRSVEGRGVKPAVQDDCRMSHREPSVASPDRLRLPVAQSLSMCARAWEGRRHGAYIARRRSLSSAEQPAPAHRSQPRPRHRACSCATSDEARSTARPMSPRSARRGWSPPALRSAFAVEPYRGQHVGEVVNRDADLAAALAARAISGIGCLCRPG